METGDDNVKPQPITFVNGLTTQDQAQKQSDIHGEIMKALMQGIERNRQIARTGNSQYDTSTINLLLSIRFRDDGTEVYATCPPACCHQVPESLMPEKTTDSTNLVEDLN